MFFILSLNLIYIKMKEVASSVLSIFVAYTIYLAEKDPLTINQSSNLA